ncbi:MAG: hypothetical protein AB7P12_00915 [Alphaproteobacteria bacterium]
MDTYWRRVHRAAFKRAFANTGGTVMNLVYSLVSIALLVWGLAVWGSSDAARDEIIARTILAAFSAALLVGQYVYWIRKIPAEWDDTKNREIENLKARSAPTLRFVYDKDDEKYYQRQSEITKGIGVEYFAGRVAVKNDSETETVRSAELTLINYRKDGDNKYYPFDRKLRAPSLNKFIIDVHPQRTENFDLFRIRGANRGRQIRFGPFADGSYTPLPPGKYAVKVTASADCMNRVYQMYFIELETSQKVTFRPWQPGDTSHSFSLADINQSGLLERPLPEAPE